MLNESTIKKATSFEYASVYQAKQAEKYQNREHNHWKIRIDLARRLVDDYALPRLKKPISETILVDLACSIGTFAIEFSKLGYQSHGIDFDTEALEIAEQLNREEGTSARFIHDDISTWQPDFAAVDIVVCMDVFEHLHDDELGGMLQSVRRVLSDQGSLVFHTFPTYYDYVFQNANGRLRLPLMPFRRLPTKAFTRLVRAYASLLDAVFLIKRGIDHKTMIKRHPHCNPYTPERLADILQRARFTILYLESAQLYPLELFSSRPHNLRGFSHQPITQRNVFGVATPAR